MRGKNDLQYRIAVREQIAREQGQHFGVKLSEDMMLKAAYVAFESTPEALDKLRAEFRNQYIEWSDKIGEDYKWDKELWYSSEVHEREMRSILGEYYEEKEDRFWK